MKRTVNVKGMHCASCASIISRNISKLSGVESCTVNVASEKASLEYDPKQVSIDLMNQKIGKFGYSFVDSSINHSEHLGFNQSKADKLQELIELRKKVDFALPIAALVFALMIWDLVARLFTWLPRLPMPMALFNTISFLLATIILFWIGLPFLNAVKRFVIYRVANMDTLVGIGTSTAYLYSALVFLMPPVANLLQIPEHTYFDITIVVIGFVIFGKYLEARSKVKTGDAIEKLVDLQAKTAIVIRNKKELEIPIEQVEIGDILLIKPGQKIPVDGEIMEGASSIDEAMITGESVSVDKKQGDKVIGSTINKQGVLYIKATKIGNDTVLSQIIKMVEDAQGSKAPIERLADKVSAVFVAVVLVFAILVLLTWLLVAPLFLPFSQAITLALLSFVGILVIACPCAMGLATPTAIIVGVGKAAANGILIKSAENLEKFNSINFIVMDKTGTLTKGEPELTDIKIIGSYLEKEVIQILASIESYSEHPLAKAIVKKAWQLKIKLHKVQQFSVIEGKGLQGNFNEKRYLVGNVKLAQDLSLKVDEKIITSFSLQGKTPIILMTQKNIIAYVGIADTVKDDAKKIVSELHKQNLKIAMLTGDNQNTAQYIASQIGIDLVIAEVLPAEKANEIKKLQKQGYHVAMVGDGINDAPALATADVGVAMGTGTDVAIESAGITLLGGQISKIPKAIRLARATMKTIKQNLFWAFFYNVIGIPVAAGLLYPIFGILLNPAIAGAAMAFSSVSVVLNALRLKTVKL